ncbi:response regulator transcription factor [Lentilitoribacter sp. Alg239-R112]|jgi:DNA-binding response OmpR family regulator|uniref:response regulator transcription factor n=1 Tax=Lentilitoribacter sp. Alg239-R112 TaxID=2305987 RepID=UPI0013A6A888|nr:response regulator transcription factor [Lentilitoribacter sp. Alg239-R112]
MKNALAHKIAIVEDDCDIAENIRIAVESYGFTARHFESASAFEIELEVFKPDLCLIDLGLPDQNGLDLIKLLNDKYQIASIIISGRRGLSDKIVGLEMGADDYISKPFETAELIARIRTVLRRTEKASTPAVINDTYGKKYLKAFFDDWTIDLTNYSLTHVDGHSTPLTKAEMDIMKMFISGPNRLFSRSQILNTLDIDAEQNFDRSIDVRISRLRSKLNEDPQAPKLIKTIYGAGYMFVANVTWE